MAEEIPTSAVEPKTGHTFLRDVAQLAALAEEAIRKLRTEKHGDGFKFEDMDLSHLFIGSQDSPDSEYLKYRLKPAVLTYLQSTAPLGLNGRADSRIGTPIEENTSQHDFTVTAWMSSVYRTRKEEIDRRVEEGIRQISRNATSALRDIVFDVCSSSSEIDRALAVAGRPALTLEELTGKMYELKTALYQTELPRPEDLAQLYELCFNAEVNRRGWLELEDDKLIETLTAENVPLEMFRKYNPEREIKVPEKKKNRTGRAVIDKIIELVGGNPAAGRSRTEDAGSQRSSQILILDPASAENNANKNQDQWIVYWNKVTDGRRFASMADYYQVFKQLTDALRNGSSAERASAEQSIASLRKDFQENYLFTSTRIIYQPNSLEAGIIHGFGAANPQPTSERSLAVPLYWDTPIAEAYGTDAGLAYLQALFNTEDSGQAIAEKLSVVSGYQPQDIKLWTPPLQSNSWLTRSRLAGRAVGLSSGSGGFSPRCR